MKYSELFKRRSLNRLLILSLLSVPTELLAASYIINLQSTTTPVDINSVKPIAGSSQQLFSSIYNKNGTKWHRLQLGHFSDRQSARALLKGLKKRYPGAWISRVSSVAKKSKELPNKVTAKAPKSGNITRVSVTRKRDLNLPKTVSNSTSGAAQFLITLRSSTRPIDLKDVKPIPGSTQQLFTSVFSKDGVTWHRLQFGYFSDYQSARMMLKSLKRAYPGAWISKASITKAGDAIKKSANTPKPVKAVKSGSLAKVRAKAEIGTNSPKVSSSNRGGITQYLVTLQSTTIPVDLKNLKPIPGLSQSFLTSIYNKGGVKWHRLQLGYFNDLQSARASLKSLNRRFPGAWISKVTVTAGKSTSPAKVATKNAGRTSPRLADNRTNFPYVVNLQITNAPITPATLPPLTLPKGAVLYTTATQRRDQSWHYLRVGFFADREGASRWVNRLSSKYPSNYPGARVLKVTRHERENAFSTLIEPSSLAKISVTDRVVLRATKKESNNARLEEAKQAMVDGDHNRAISIYRAILGNKAADAVTQQSALELLAFAYERKGIVTMARKHYQNYLKLYPKGDASERVRQRLASMESATAKSKLKLRERKSVTREKNSLYGSFSVYYRHDADIEDNLGANTNQSSVQSYLDLTSRTRTDDHDFRARFSGGYVMDLLNGDNNGMNLSNFHIDYRNEPDEWSTIVGRQSGNSGGVLGRFDGLQLSKKITATNKINFVTGNLVESSRDALLKGSKKFYGISSDLGTFAQSWDFQAYAIQQTAGSFLDRRAIGGEVRYFQPNGTLFGLFDYDLNLKSINTMLLIGGFTMADKGRVNFMIDQRNSPTMSLSNALQGQTATTLEELALSYNNDEIKQLAKDRTALSRSLMVGYSRPIDSRLQFSSDVTVSNISATPASGGVMATDASGNNYYINLRLNVKELLIKGDLSLLSLTYASSRDMTTTTLGFNSRFPYRDHWRLNPRLYLDYRQNRVASDNYVVLRPSIRATNHQWKKHTFELEAGLDFTTQTDVENGYYISLGYHNKF